MAGDVQIRIEGLKELRRELRRLDGNWPKSLRETNREAAKVAVPSVQSLAPKRSGTLAGSVRALASQTRSQLAVGTNVRVPYAGPINFGWPGHGIEPQEFIYSGIEAANARIVDTYFNMVDDLTRRAFPG